MTFWCCQVPAKKKGLALKYIHVDMVATLGDDAKTLSIEQKWADEFREVRESVEDDPKRGCYATATIEEAIDSIHDLVMDAR